MPRYTPLALVDEKLRDLKERRKIVEPVCSTYLPYENESAAPQVPKHVIKPEDKSLPLSDDGQAGSKSA